MKRDFSVLIRDLDEKEIHLPASQAQLARIVMDFRNRVPDDMKPQLDDIINKEIGKPLSLSEVCVASLTGAFAGEETLSDDDRKKRMQLARKLHKGGIVDVSIDELALIKPLVVKRYGGIVIPVVTAEMLEREIP